MLLNEFHIGLRRVKEEVPHWEEDKTQTHWRYGVVVTFRGKSEEFEFWGSANDWKNNLDPNPKEVLGCILSDATCYLDSKDIDDFAAEFGYTKPSQAIKAYEGCKAEYEQLERLGLDQDDVISLSVDVNQ